VKEKKATSEVIIEEEQEIDDVKFMIYLAKP